VSAIAVFGALESGLVFALVALGVYVSFRLLDFPDLTVDGSFPLGGCTAATLLVSGWNPFAATAIGAAAAALAGLVTAILHVRLRLLHLLASILVMLALYSVNLRIMGRPNTPLFAVETVFSPLDALPLPSYVAVPLALALLVLLIKIGLDRFLATELGLALRAAGGNAVMAAAHGISRDRMVLLGLALSNAIVGLAGALFVQSQGVADVSMGPGVIIIGLASLIVGETLLSPMTVFLSTLGCIAGAIFYRFATALALDLGVLGLKAQDLNLITAVLVVLALALGQAKPALRLPLRPRAAAADLTVPGAGGVGRRDA
jgi:putative ABC transport system permease protein